MAQAGEIRFDAVIDTSGYEKGVKDIQNATDEIKESAEQADKATEDVGKNGGKHAPSIKDAFSKTFDGIGELADGLGLSLPSKLVKVASIGGALAAVGGVFKTGIDTAISQIDVQGTLDAQLGKGSVAAQNAGKVAGELYRQGWGESLEDVANVASNVSQVIRGIGEGDLNTVTKATEVWAQTFDADAGESVRGVKVLMEKFGLSAQDATDLMTKGMQNGLNYTDELADNLSEYGGRWAEAGTSAQEYFSLLQAGVDSGAYQLDKVGDFLNEFLTSLTDGRIEQSIGEFSKGTQDVFNNFKSGKATAEDVLNSVIGEMGTMTDKTKEASLASTLWSSLGEDNALGMIEALGNVPNSYQNIKGATDEAADSTMSIGQQWEAFKRTMSGTLGDAFTPFVKGFLDGLTDMAKKFTDFVNNTDWSGLANILGSVGSVVGKAFEAIGNSIQPALDLLKAFSDWFSANSTWIVSALVGIGAGLPCSRQRKSLAPWSVFLSRSVLRKLPLQQRNGCLTRLWRLIRWCWLSRYWRHLWLVWFTFSRRLTRVSKHGRTSVRPCKTCGRICVPSSKTFGIVSPSFSPTPERTLRTRGMPSLIGLAVSPAESRVSSTILAHGSGANSKKPKTLL